MDIDLSGVGSPIQNNIPVGSEGITKKSENLLESVASNKPDSLGIEKKQTAPINERSYRTRFRELKQSVPDRLSSNDVRRDNRVEVKIEKPQHSNSSNSTGKLTDLIKEMQKQYPLPKSEDLVKNLTNETRAAVAQMSRQALGDPDLVNPKLFFETLSKMVPLALAVINGKEGQASPAPSAQVSAMLTQMMKDLAPHINRLLAEETLPKDLKEQLQLLSQQLGAQPKMESGDGTKNVLFAADRLMETLQTSTVSNTKAMHQLATKLAMFHLMNNALTLPELEQGEFIKSMMTNQVLFSGENVTKGLLGSNTQEFAGEISEMVIALAGKISQAVNIPLLKESSNEGLLKLFSSLLFGGTLLGKMIADRGDGKAWGLDEAYAGMLQMQSAKELKIFDLVPFSLFTSFSPLRDEGGLSDAQKAALKYLRELIHQMMNLVFLLTATYSAGQKIGEGGIDFLLEKNSELIRNAIVPLMLTLSKVHETFQIDIKAPLAYLKLSLDAIDKKEHSVFWSHIFAFFTDENELNTFLEEVDELDPFYQSIHLLMAQK